MYNNIKYYGDMFFYLNKGSIVSDITVNHKTTSAKMHQQIYM